MQIEQPEVYMEDKVEVRNPYTGETLGENLVVKQNPHLSTESPHWVFFDPDNSRLITTGGDVIVIKHYTS